MKDLTIKGTGNSRFLKSIENFKAQYPTYDDFAAALVAGTLPVDFNGLNPDGVEQLGTPTNKSALLTDEVAEAIGLTSEDPTVNEALHRIAQKIRNITGEVAEMTLTVLDAGGAAVPGAAVTNLVDFDGAPVITDSDGIARGYIDQGEITLSVLSPYIDISGGAKTYTAVAGGTYTDTITLADKTTTTINTSQNVMFSQRIVEKDVSVKCIGGGGGGGSAGAGNGGYYGSGGGGGGGGLIVSSTVQPSPLVEYSAIVGAGGTGGSEAGNLNYGKQGGKGGETSFFGVSASGGNGGGYGSYDSYVDGGPGGTGTGKGGDGGASTSTASSVGGNGGSGSGGYGGGGGGGAGYNHPASRPDPASGGDGGGGNGGGGSLYHEAEDGTSGTGGGGGGGGAPGRRGGNGGSGCIILSFYA